MIPTIKQRIKLVGEDRALRETEAWVDGLLAENKRLKFQQDQLRLVLGSGEPLHVDYETLLELARLFKEDLAAAKAEVTRLTDLNADLRSTINSERSARTCLERDYEVACDVAKTYKLVIDDQAAKIEVLTTHTVSK